jgi:hypothetical protein
MSAADVDARGNRVIVCDNGTGVRAAWRAREIGAMVVD